MVISLEFSEESQKGSSYRKPLALVIVSPSQFQSPHTAVSGPQPVMYSNKTPTYLNGGA